MKQKRHIIKKQIIELNLSSQSDAFELQNEVSRIYRHKIIPLIDQLLSQFSNGDTIHRLNTLEVNLGNININNLEQELIAKVRAEISKQLEDKFSSQTEILTTTENQTDVGNSNNFLNQQDHDFKDLQISDLDNNRGSQLEIFSYFLQTGILPWWAENLSKQELEELSDRLITNSPDRLNSIILESLKNAKQLQRLIYQFSDAILLKIAGLLSTDLVKFIADYNIDIKDIFKQLEQTKNIPEAKLRLDRWQGIFLTISADSHAQVDKLRLVQANLLHISSSNGINYPEFLNNIAAKINNLIREGNKFSSTLPEIINNLSFSQPNTELIGFEEQAKILLRELQKLSQNRQISAESKQEINQLHHQIEILLNKIKNTSFVNNQSNQITKLNQLLQIAQTLITKIQPELNFNQSKLSNSVDTFSDADEIYIHNAGLILLWPFLNRFLVTIALVEKSIFLDIISAQKAVLLLQFLVDNSTAISEHNLPLNKILCGIDLLEPIDTNLEITELERAECEKLLSAVIQNWSILKNTSVEGLRKAFLQRNGILRIRDGSWLLQVERETYDILLDKIPWSIQVIKLPWMDNILYVEW